MRPLFHGLPGASFILLTGLALAHGQGPQAATLPPAPPTPSTPVAYFRQLLSATPAERDRLLAGKSPQQLRVLTNSIRTYLALPEAEREARLRTMELRSQLAPLLRLAPVEREERLRKLPQPDREVIQLRLVSWDRLSTNVQRQVLEYEQATRARMGSTRMPEGLPLPPMPAAAGLSPTQQAALESVLAPWKAITPARQQEAIMAFTNLFSLPAGLNSKSLDPLPLSPAERVLIEKALQSFRQMEPEQRQACVNGFKRFAELPAAERVQFLRTAEAWQKMSPEDRQRWRDLVNRMPKLPPMPPGFGAPPLPPVARPQKVPDSSAYVSNSSPSR